MYIILEAAVRTNQCLPQVYLNNPVHIALETAKGGGYTHRSEDTKDGTTRAEKSYYREGIPYAAFDYKKPVYLDKAQLKAGIARNVDQYARNLDAASSGTSVWEPGIKVILKQAVHYSYKFDTPFVALCD